MNNFVFFFFLFELAAHILLERICYLTGMKISLLNKTRLFKAEQPFGLKDVEEIGMFMFVCLFVCFMFVCFIYGLCFVCSLLFMFVLC